jgi:hypothetical protein
MKLIFQSNTEPCIEYEVLEEWESYQYDEVVFKKYVPCRKLEILGYVPSKLLKPSTNHPQNIKAIDLAIHIQNKK